MYKYYDSFLSFIDDLKKRQSSMKISLFIMEGISLYGKQPTINASFHTQYAVVLRRASNLYHSDERPPLSCDCFGPTEANIV